MFSTDTFNSSAMKVRMRAESSTPAMPITRSRGKPLRRYTAWHIASSGFATGTMMQLGECLTTSEVTAFMMPKLTFKQIVAAHPRLARHARRDDHDVGIGRLRVVAAANHAAVGAGDRAGLQDVERDPGRLLVGDIDDDDVGELFVGDAARHRGLRHCLRHQQRYFAIHLNLLEDDDQRMRPQKPLSRAFKLCELCELCG